MSHLQSSWVLTESRSNYKIGWISVLPLEFYAARRMLDQEYQQDDLALGRGSQYNYVLGRIGQHDVVLNCPAAGRYGELQATKVAADMKKSFPWIRFVLLVGIGGGVPVDHDIRLGDIVTATTVLPYDFGKKTDRGFEITGKHVFPPDVLLSTVTELEYRLQSKSLSQMIEQIVNVKGGHRSEYSRPKRDRLYFTDFLHCAQCDCLRDVPEHLSKVRRYDPRSGSLVRTHQGTIGSANRVLKNASIRDDLAREHKIMCVEMEATGVMASTGCLPIRGISDYADGHKNDEWQPYAALAAAVYARELLKVMSTALVAGCELNVSGDVLETFVKAVISSADAFLSAKSFPRFSNGGMDRNSVGFAKCVMNTLMEAYNLTEELLLPELEKLEDIYCANRKFIRTQVEDLGFWQDEIGHSLIRLGQSIDRQSKATTSTATKAEWENLKAEVNKSISRIQAGSTDTKNALDRALPVQSMLMYESMEMRQREEPVLWKVRHFPQSFTRNFGIARDRFKHAIKLVSKPTLDASQPPSASEHTLEEKTPYEVPTSTTNPTRRSWVRKRMSGLGVRILSGLCGI